MEKVFCYNCDYFRSYGYKTCIHPYNIELQKVSEDTYCAPAQYVDKYLLKPKVINKDNQCKWWLKKEIYIWSK